MKSDIKFKVIFSKEAGAFLSALAEKARRKILYNIDKAANGEIDEALFKKLENTDIYGSSERDMQVCI